MRRQKNPKPVPKLRKFKPPSVLFTVVGAGGGYFLNRFYSKVSYIHSFYPSRLIKAFSSGRGLTQYSQIGKTARDILYGDYNNGFKACLHFDAYRANLGFTPSTPPLGSFVCRSTYRSLLSSEIEVGLHNNIHLNCKLGSAERGVTMRFTFPDENSSEVGLNYVHGDGNVNLSTSLGLFQNPRFRFSGTTGNHLWCLGTQGSLHINDGLTQLDFGASYLSENFVFSMTARELGGVINASFSHSPQKDISVAVELSRARALGENQLTLGFQHVSGKSLLKARVSTPGNLAGLVQHNWTEHSFYRVSAELPRNGGVRFGCVFSYGSSKD